MSSGSINLVIVGDGAVGKTCLLVSYLENRMPLTYEPTVCEKYTGSLTVNNENLDLKIWDTAGQSDHERIRGFTYSDIDAVILCFSVVHEVSYENVRCKWSEEIIKHLPNVPIILVGTKIDLRGQVLPGFSRVITYELGSRLAKRINADSYVECSALTNVNVKLVFDKAIKAVLERRAATVNSNKKNRSRKKSSSSRSRSRHARHTKL